MSVSALQGITVFERGWLSSNNVLLHDLPDDGDAGAVLVDSSHVLHAAQTVALVKQALGATPLGAVVNTHLHSDHCGGNASLAREYGCRVIIPPGQWREVAAWDEEALSYAPTGQRCERFSANATLAPGDTLAAGGRRWQVLAAPGHDPHSIILFDPRDGIAITADALWERGFGVVFPELDGEAAFDDVARVLELIASLGARVAIPGHGAPFADVPAALARARERLAGFRAEPARHARHAVKVLVKYHLLEVQREPLAELHAWFERAALFGRVWLRLGRPDGSAAAFGERIVGELVAGGALALRDGVVLNT